MRTRRYEWYIALRYLRARRKQMMLSIITIISALGVMLGVASLVIVLALMTGFQEELRDKILGTNAHIVIYSLATLDFDKYEETIATLWTTEGVEAAAPFIYRKVMIKHRRTNDGIICKGIDPETSGRVTDIARNLREGSLQEMEPNADGVPGIVIGDRLSLALGVVLDDEVQITAPNEIQTPAGLVPKTKIFRVAGIFESGMFDYDSSWGYISLDAAQKLFDIPGKASGIEIRVTNMDQAPEVAERIHQTLGNRFMTRDWREMNKELYAALELEKWVAGIFLVLIILVAAFGIISSLTMMVMEKSKDIGILKAMGATNRGVRQVFMYQGLTIGAVGTVIGCVLGVTACLVLDTYKLIPLAPDVYFISYVPFHLRPLDVAGTCVASMLISLLATLPPSWSASWMNPVEAIRNE